MISRDRAFNPKPVKEDQFYESDAELQEADSDVIREFGHDAMNSEEEYGNEH